MGRKGKKDREQLLLSWTFPPQGWYKLNVDGSRILISGCIGGGGVIRNENGEWVAGFSANFKTGKVIEAELMALFKGLELASKYGYTPIEVESDSKLVVNLVLNVEQLYQQHHLITLIKSCRDAVFSKNLKCTLSHVYRQQNCVADCLASLGLTVEEGVTYFDVPPSSCEASLDEDRRMIARPRLLSFRKLKYPNDDFIPRAFRLKSHYHHSLKKLKVKASGDDLAPLTFTWRIDNFSKLNTTSKHYSDVFFVGDSKWRILLYLKGNAVDYLSPYLDVPDASKLPQGWSKCAKFSLTVVNQIQPAKSITKDAVHVFNTCESNCGFRFLVPLSWLFDHGNEYLVNDICILEAKVVLHKANAKILEDDKIVASAAVELSVQEFKEQGSNMESVKASDSLKTCKALDCEQVPTYQDAPSLLENICCEQTDPLSFEDVL